MRTEYTWRSLVLTLPFLPSDSVDIATLVTKSNAIKYILNVTHVCAEGERERERERERRVP